MDIFQNLKVRATSLASEKVILSYKNLQTPSPLVVQQGLQIHASEGGKK